MPTSNGPTDDEKFLVHGGRRWRRTDPSLPADVRDLLASYLGKGRSGVRTHSNDGDADGVAAARHRVQLAKEGLGERGTPWWEQSPAERRGRWEAALAALREDALRAEILSIAELRGPEKTLCPSDAARSVGGDSWRTLMPRARQLAFELADEGLVDVTQKGEKVSGPDVRGPIRIRWKDRNSSKPPER